MFKKLTLISLLIVGGYNLYHIISYIDSILLYADFYQLLFYIIPFILLALFFINNNELNIYVIGSIVFINLIELFTSSYDVLNISFIYLVPLLIMMNSFTLSVLIKLDKKYNQVLIITGMLLVYYVGYSLYTSINYIIIILTLYYANFIFVSLNSKKEQPITKIEEHFDW